MTKNGSTKTIQMAAGSDLGPGDVGSVKIGDSGFGVGHLPIPPLASVRGRLLEFAGRM
jgi:hypothetical protein